MRRFATKVAVGVLGLLACAGSAMAQPHGAPVVSGTAAINKPPVGLPINQTNPPPIINWQSFTINPGDTTRVVQPNSSAATLNRVVEKGATPPLGTLQVNPSSIGGVQLPNPNINGLHIDPRLFDAPAGAATTVVHGNDGVLRFLGPPAVSPSRPTTE